MPEKSGSIVSSGPGSDMFSPLIRRVSKFDGEVVADVIAEGDIAAPGSPAKMAELPNDAITKSAATMRRSDFT